MSLLLFYYSGYEAVDPNKLHPSLKKAHVQMELRR